MRTLQKSIFIKDYTIKYSPKKKCLKISYVHSKINKEKFRAALYGRNEELLWKRQWRKL